MPKAWVVVSQDNEQSVWYESFRAMLTRRFPKVERSGFVWLDGFPYVHDATRDVSEDYYPKKYLGLIKKTDFYAYWRLNEPDQMNMTDQSLTPGSIGITGDTIRQYAKSQHLSRLIENPRDWIVAILCAFVGLGAGYIIASIALRAGK